MAAILLSGWPARAMTITELARMEERVDDALEEVARLQKARDALNAAAVTPASDSAAPRRARVVVDSGPLRSLGALSAPRARGPSLASLWRWHASSTPVVATASEGADEGRRLREGPKIASRQCIGPTGPDHPAVANAVAQAVGPGTNAIVPEIDAVRQSSVRFPHDAAVAPLANACVA